MHSPHSLLLLLLFVVSGQSLLSSAPVQCPGGYYATVANQLAAYAPARSYCAAKYPIPPVTSTVTASTITVTIQAGNITTTSTASPVTTTVVASAITTTSTAPAVTTTLTVSTESITTTVATSTSTITAPAVTTTTTVSTSTVTTTVETDTVTLTSTDSTSTTVTTTITTIKLAKRQMHTAWEMVSVPSSSKGSPVTSTSSSTTKPNTTTTSVVSPTTKTTSSTSPPPKSTTNAMTSSPKATTTTDATLGAWNGMLAQAGSVVATFCTCLQTPSTITTTMTPKTTVAVTSTVTRTATPTTTATSTPTSTETTTPTSTATTTATTIIPVTSTTFTTTTPTETSSVTDTTTSSVTATITTSTTITTTSTEIVSTTTTRLPKGPYCTDTSDPTDTGLGGCSKDCYCDSRNSAGSLGICDDAQTCGPNCSNDYDCPDGQACAIGGWFAGCSGGSSCVSYTSCSSTAKVSKRSLFGLGADIVPRSGRMKFPPPQGSRRRSTPPQ